MRRGLDDQLGRKSSVSSRPVGAAVAAAGAVSERIAAGELRRIADEQRRIGVCTEDGVDVAADTGRTALGAVVEGVSRGLQRVVRQCAEGRILGTVAVVERSRGIAVGAEGTWKASTTGHTAACIDLEVRHECCRLVMKQSHDAAAGYMEIAAARVAEDPAEMRMAAAHILTAG